MNNNNVIVVKLSETEKIKKYQLAAIAGFKVKEIDDTGRCIIIGADKCIDNDFRNIDELLLQIKSVLLRRKQHFKIVA
jgi:hypothetical protein